MKKLRAMMIGAHPDDCDLRCGGLTLKYSDAGAEVMFLSLCDGSGGHQSMAPADVKARRYGETQAVARYAGIQYKIWDVPDCEIVPDLELRKRLIRDIREFQPDIIFCHRPNDYHADHRAASQLVQDASYLLIVPNCCPEVPALKEMPVIVYFYDNFKNPPFEPDVIVRTDDVIERKFKLLSNHVSQLFEWLPFTNGTLDEVPEDEAGRMEFLHGPRLPRDHMPSVEEVQALRHGSSCEAREGIQAAMYRDLLVKRYGEIGKTTYFAESFQICEYGTRPDAAKLAELFPF